MFLPTVQNGNQSQQNGDCQRHCILISASNPHPLSTPVFRPQIQNLDQSESIDGQTENRLSDAETIAKSFAQVIFVIFPSLSGFFHCTRVGITITEFIFPLQCLVSLSVISPKQLPKLRAIYNAVTMNISNKFSSIYHLSIFHSFPNCRL